MAFKFLPGGSDWNTAEGSLDFIEKEERELRARYEKAKADKLKLKQSPPSYFNSFQFTLACQQADEDISTLSGLLCHLEHKLSWEKNKKWKSK